MKNTQEKCLDSQLWHACAGGMVQMPPVNSRVYYFPQGHAEHAHGNVEFGNRRVDPCILCRVVSIKYMADPETDEVFAKLRLIPLGKNESESEDDGALEIEGMENSDKVASFAKTLTQSDANNGGGFSVPRYCAETIFPRLDYSAEPPVQTIIAKDVHGECWKFRHIYRGTPRRHLLTTGWSNFVNQKKLVAGDSIVFLRAENGDLCVGIRRAKRGIGGSADYVSGWNSNSGNGISPFGGYSMFMREDGTNAMPKHFDGDTRGKVTPESVVQAASLAVNGQPFEVMYYPRAGTPEFFVKASLVSNAMRIQWCSGIRFKMPFETEDASRISWFMGTISKVKVADPIRWPKSPWRLLEVEWDEPDLLQNVKCVSPWLVELVSNMPAIHLSPFSPPRKKLRASPTTDFPLMDQLPMPPYPNNNPLRHGSSLLYLSDNIPAGIQGARHAQLGLSSSDLHFNKLQSGLLSVGSQQLSYTSSVPTLFPGSNLLGAVDGNENISCLLTMGGSTHSLKENGEKKAPHILLFGKLILPEPQSSDSSSADTMGKSLSDANMEKMSNSSDGSGGVLARSQDSQKTDRELETGHRKVFMESESVGRTLDLSLLNSYEELHGNLADMFEISGSEKPSNILYRDSAGAVKHTGDEPFSDFLRTAKRLMIPTGSSIVHL